MPTVNYLQDSIVFFNERMVQHHLLLLKSYNLTKVNKCKCARQSHQEQIGLKLENFLCYECKRNDNSRALSRTLRLKLILKL